MKKIILLLLTVFVFIAGLSISASAAPANTTVECLEDSCHTYFALGQTRTLFFDVNLGPSNCGWGWKIYRLSLNGTETQEDLDAAGLKLMTEGASCVTQEGGVYYNDFYVHITPEERINANTLGVGTYLFVGYAYKYSSGEIIPYYDAMCTIALHVLKEAVPLTGVNYYLCDKDGNNLQLIDTSTPLIIPHYLEGVQYLYVEKIPSNATVEIRNFRSSLIPEDDPFGVDLIFGGDDWAEGLFPISGQTCGQGSLSIGVDFFDKNGKLTYLDPVAVTVPCTKDDQLVVFKKSTCTEPGLQGYRCVGWNCQTRLEVTEIPLLAHKLNGDYQIIAEPTATQPGVGRGTCVNCRKTAECPVSAIFTDTVPTKYYCKAVDYCYENELVQGTSATTFSPEENCTRGQIVTFLWRAAGEPKAENAVNPFVDVAEGSYYYDAVLWAVENGITEGTDETHFDPKGTCTRAQAVTFLWRAANKPDPKAESHPFSDVQQSYYTDAVLWAVENGITTGMTETTFEPNTNCNRAQIVTFLYRYKVG